MAIWVPGRDLTRPVPADAPRPGPVLAAGSLAKHPVLLACVATVCVHLLFMSRRLGADEGGLLVVARHWDAPGTFLYGPSWVDRPPVLVAAFAVADLLGPYGVRLTALVVAVGLVAAAGWAAGAVRGRPAAGWAAWTAFAFSSSSMLHAEQLNGELLAAAAVMVSVAALLQGLYAGSARHPRIMSLGLLAGLAAATAVFVKQSFVDGVVFGAVLLVATVVARPVRRDRARRLAGWFTVGALAGCAAVLGWAWSRHRVGALVYAMYGFRADAAQVLAGWSLRAPLQRLHQLGVTSVVSGLLVLLAVVAVANARRLRRLDPLTAAVGAATAVATAGVVGGGSYWSHYLIALVPMTALAAGLTSAGPARTTGGRWRATRAVVVAVAALTSVSAPVAAYQNLGTTSASFTTGRWVAESAHPGDTLTVAYTHANVLEASGLAPAYPYAWSLPIRTLDPTLDLLAGRLRSPQGPTWFVQWDRDHAWGLDPDGRVSRALLEHYRRAATVCGHPVWLQRGAHRRPAAIPASRLCGPGAT